MEQFSGMMNMGIDVNQMTDRFEQTRAVIEEVNKQFKNPVIIDHLLYIIVYRHT